MAFVNRRALDDARSSAGGLRRGHASTSSDRDSSTSRSSSSGGSSSNSSGSTSGGPNGARLFEEDPEPAGHSISTVHLFDEEDESGQARAARMRQIREAGASVLSLATKCAAQHLSGGARAAANASAPTPGDHSSLPVHESARGSSSRSIGATASEVDALGAAVTQWLQTLR